MSNEIQSMNYLVINFKHLFHLIENINRYTFNLYLLYNEFIIYFDNDTLIVIVNLNDIIIIINIQLRCQWLKQLRFYLIFNSLLFIFFDQLIHEFNNFLIRNYFFEILINLQQ